MISGFHLGEQDKGGQRQWQQNCFCLKETQNKILKSEAVRDQERAPAGSRKSKAHAIASCGDSMWQHWRVDSWDQHTVHLDGQTDRLSEVDANVLGSSVRHRAQKGIHCRHHTGQQQVDIHARLIAKLFYFQTLCSPSIVCNQRNLSSSPLRMITLA